MKNLENLITKIREQNHKYGDELQQPASSEELDSLERQVNQVFSVNLPPAYIYLLLQTDGLDNDGIVLYSSKKSLIQGYSDRYIPGLLEANEDWQDFSGYLFYADSDMYLFVQSMTDKTFSYRSRERFDEVIFSTMDDVLFFEIILKLALGENIEEEYSN